MTATPSAASATQAAHRRLKVCFRRGGARGDAVSALERSLCAAGAPHERPDGRRQRCYSYVFRTINARIDK